MNESFRISLKNLRKKEKSFFPAQVRTVVLDTQSPQRREFLGKGTFAVGLYTFSTHKVTDY